MAEITFNIDGAYYHITGPAGGQAHPSNPPAKFAEPLPVTVPIVAEDDEATLLNKARKNYQTKIVAAIIAAQSIRLDLNERVNVGKCLSADLTAVLDFSPA